MRSDILHCPRCREASSATRWHSRHVEDEAQCPLCNTWVRRTDLNAYTCKMKGACEDAFRESYYAIITDVIDPKKAQALLDKVAPPSLEEFVKTTKRALENAPPGTFSVMMERQGFLGSITVPSDIFPQSQEWSEARIGKLVHVTVTQPAQVSGGVLTVEVRDPKE